MNVQELITELQSQQYKTERVYIHDPNTGRNIPIGTVETEYEGRRVLVVIHANDETEKRCP